MKDILEKHRIVKGPYASKPGSDYGAFFIPFKFSKTPLKVICGPMSSETWQHVSVSLPDRCPTWDEMCFIKDLFWDEEHTVMQLHPPKSEWISNAKYCLHLWRYIGGEIPMPPAIMVGIKELGELS